MKTKYFSLLIVILFVSSTFSTIRFLSLDTTRIDENQTESAVSPQTDRSVRRINDEMISRRTMDDEKNLTQKSSNPLAYNLKDKELVNDADIASIREISHNSGVNLDSIPKIENLAPIDGVSDYFFYRPNKINPQNNPNNSSIVKVVGNKIEIVIKTGQDFNLDLFEGILDNIDAEIIKYQNSLRAYLVKVPLDKVEHLQSQISSLTDFKYMELHFYRTLFFTPNDPSWGEQWGPQLIGLEDAWNATTGNKSIIVAIVDTGIDYTHPDLSDAYLPLGYDWYNDDDDPFDDHYHGTHVAGTIAATINNTIGIAGVVNVSVFVEKIFGADDGYAGDIDAAAAIEHAVARGAQVISNSWGGGGYSQLIADAVDNAVGNGCIVVFAAGNDGMESVSFPASLPNVIAVSATDSSDNLATFSNYGEEIDIAAPGVDILSSVPGNSYEYLSGTSMATPHVSGLVALIMSQFPDYSPEAIKQLLYWSALDLGSSGRDNLFGHGRINAATAMLGLPEYDLSVQLEMDTLVQINEIQSISIDVANWGIYNESNVEVNLYLDGAIIESLIIENLTSLVTYNFPYEWIPTSLGTFNFTAYVVPGVNETYLGNNIATQFVTVAEPIIAVSPGDYIVWMFDDLTEYSLFNFTFGQYITSHEINVSVSVQRFYHSTGEMYEDIDYWIVIDTLTRYISEGTMWWVGSYFLMMIPTNVELYDTVPIWTDATAIIGAESTYVWMGISYEVWQVNTSDGIGIASFYYEKTTGVLLHYVSSDLTTTGELITSSYLLVDHDLSVRLIVDQTVAFGDTVHVEAIVSNYGRYSETGINLSLYLDGIIVSSVLIENLANATSYTLDYEWTPALLGTYNFTTYVTPVVNETYLDNNFITKLVSVTQLTNYVESYPGYIWYDAQSNGYSLGMSGDDVSTYLDLPFAFLFYDQLFTRVYISSNGWLSFTDTNPYEYSNPSFPTTAYTYVIALLWDDLSVSNNVYAYATSEYVVIEFVDYYSLSGSLYGTFAVVLFAYGGILFLYQDIYTHESPTVGLNYGLDTEFYNAYNGYLAGLSQFAIGYNYSAPEHDLFTQLQVNTRSHINESQIVNATVSNAGLQTETDVEFSLYLEGLLVDSVILDSLINGTSYTLSYLWTPTSIGLYNFTASVIPVPDEVSLSNNLVTKIVNVLLPASVAVFRNTDPWGYLAIFDILNFNNISYDIYASSDMGIVNISSYQRVIIPSVQDSYFYSDFASNIAYFENYVTGGGILEIHAATQGTSFTLPGGAFYQYGGQDSVDIIYSGHPILCSPHLITDAELDGWSSSTHGYLTSLPVNAINILADINGEIVLSLFYLGLGNVIVTSQTVEWAWAYSYSLILENLLLYTPISYDHELITQLQVNQYVGVNTVQLVNATVYNYGLQTETDVEFSLYLDGTVIDSVVLGSLASGAKYTLIYPWTPEAAGSYNFTAYVIPILNETIISNNIATQFVTAMDIQGGWVAILNADGSDLPSYWNGGDSNEYSSIYEGLIAIGIPTIIITNDDILAGILTDVSVLVLIDNAPNTVASSIVKTWWQVGGSILSFDSSISMLNWAGMLPFESEGSNGYSTYWSYDSGSSGVLINDDHPVTAGYTYGDIIYGASSNAQYFSAIMQGTMYGEFYTPLVKSAIGSNYDYVVASDAPIGGKIVQMWDNEHWLVVSNRLMILNAINWMKTRSEHDLSARLQVNQYIGVNTVQLVNATVYNYGLQTETDVEFSLYLDGTVVDSVVLGSLASGVKFTLSYPWTPEATGSYNFTACVIPVLNETYTANNVATRFVSVMDIQGGWVAILDADGSDLPSYWTGGDSNEYSSIYEGLVANGIPTIIITNDDIQAGDLTDVSILVLIDNAPNTAASSIVKTWWQVGGSILSFDSSISMLNWAGMLPLESEGSNGYNIYWTYGTSSSGVLINDAHPVTAGYMYGEIIYGSSDDAQYFSATMQSTMYGEFYTPLVKSAIGSNYDYVVASDAPIGGKIVQIWDDGHWATSSNRLMILNAINWMFIRSDHDLSVNLQVNEYVDVGTPQLVEATVYNFGSQTETYIDLLLYLDNTLIEETGIDSLTSGASYTLSYSWTPTSAGVYNFTTYVTPVLNETYTANNYATRLVTVTDLVISDSIIILDDEDFISYGFAGSGTIEDPYLIESLSVTNPSMDFGAALYIDSTTEYFIIQNCFIQSTMDFFGIWIGSVSPGTGTIIDNTIINSGYGIALSHSDSLIVSGNTLKNNMYGIAIVESSSNLIVNNLLTENQCGIGIAFSDYNNFTYNWFINNLEYGIADYGDNMVGNHIYFNNFISDLITTSQAYDDGIDNVWYNEELLQGNYWSDWDEIGSYPIDGAAGTVDLYPLGGYCYFNPLISNVQYQPITPTDQDIITITAIVIDYIALTNISVVYQVNAGDWYSLPMITDGTTYSASFGPFEIGDTVEWYIHVIDGSNTSASSEPISFIITDGFDPIIINVQYLPAVPTYQDIITITATVTDNVGIGNVTVIYRVNGGDWQTIVMAANGSTYSAFIGPFGADSFIEFFIDAKDLANNEITSEIYDFTIPATETTRYRKISGFDLYIFVGTIIISAVILHWRKRERLNA